jgi:peptidoglycan/LPS O-acetylase OafA/YrhL
MDSEAGGGDRLPYWPALDGLRGVAVAAVLLFHGGFVWAEGGYLGVSAFFTLSGFLITSLLLTEWRNTGRISLRHFWARRLRRLMPAALLALAGIVVFGAFVADADQLRDLRADVVSALGYAANWRFIFSGQTYADLFAAPSPVQHFWSLAIEEQFYLCFPVMVLVALRVGARRGLSVMLLAAALISIGVGRWLLEAGASADRLYYGTDTRAFELLVGALLAVVVARVAHPQRRWESIAVQTSGALALVAMLTLWATIAQSDRWLHQGYLVIHAGLAAAVIAAAVQPSGPVRALLGRESVRRLGVISYGVYVYHWPVFLWLDTERTGLSRPSLFAVRVIVTVGLAVCSYHLIERPIRSGRRLTGFRPWAVAPAVAVSVCVALVVVTSNPPPPAIVYSAVFDDAAQRAAPSQLLAASQPVTSEVAPATPVAAPPSTAAAAPPSTVAPAPVRIVVLGDSVGQTVGRGIERWAARTGAAVVRNAAIGLCAIGRGGQIHLFDTGPLNQKGCVDYPARWGVEHFEPDLVVVLSTLWEVAPRRQPDWDDVRQFDEPEYQRWLKDEYVAAVHYLVSSGARVVWLTAPCAETPLSRAKFWSNEGGETAAVVSLNRIISSLPEVAPPGQLRVADLFTRVCPDGEFTPQLGDVEDARPDGLHFSDAGADVVTEWLCPWLVADPATCSRSR